jgi:putative ABC transport system permease protein
VGLALLVACVVAVFVGLVGTARDLDRSLDAFYARTRFADLLVIEGDARAIADEARATPGVAAVNQRSTTTLSIWARDGRVKVQGTVIGMPADGPVIDALDVTDGRHFRRSSTGPVAIVEAHTAEDLDLGPGDRLQALGIGSVQVLTVVGVATSPEYLLPAQSQQQVVTTPGSFAVVYVPEPVVADLGGPAAVPQVLVRYEPGARAGALDRVLRQTAVGHDAALVETRSGQPSNGIIDTERSGVEVATILVTSVAFVLAVLVGTLAAGRVHDRDTRRRRVAVATLAGTLTGLVLGIVGARVGASLLADSITLPDQERAGGFWVLLGGVGLAALVALLALAFAALDRDARTSSGAGPVVVTGVAATLAMVCVLAPAGIVDSAEATLDAATELVHTDAQVAFATPVGGSQLDELRSVAGVVAAETAPSGEVVVRHVGARYATVMQAFRANTSMQDFARPNGSLMTLADGGASIPVALAEILDARVGDAIEVTLPGAGVAPFRVPVAALLSNTLGNLVFLRIPTLRDAMGADADAFAGGLFDTAAIRYEEGTTRAGAARIARDVRSLPGVVVFVPVQESLQSVASVRPIFATITDVLIGIGVVVALLGIGTAVLLHARTRRSASPSRWLLEVLGAAVVGIGLGCVLGTVAADHLVDRLDSDLVHLVRDLDPATYLLAAAGVLLVTVVTLAVSLLSGRNRGTGGLGTSLTA